MRIAIVSFTHAIGVAWPAVVLITVGLLLWTKAGKALLTSLRQVKFGQLQVDLGKDSPAEVKSALEDVFRRNRKAVSRQFEEVSHVHRVDELRNAVARGVLAQTARHQGFRCTVYVPDVLFDDSLYCLLDYWPKGKAAGKAYSVRYGIIGRAWRLLESQAKDVVPGDRNTLLAEWGMTDREAAGHTQARSFLAVLLTLPDVQDDPVGIVFADGDPNTFAEQDCDRVAQAPETRRLAAAVSEVVAEMRQRGPVLRVFER